MSKPPTPKQNFIQTLLIVTTIFLGFQIFCRPQQTPIDNLSSEQILTQARADSELLKDQTLVNQDLPKLQGKVDEEIKAKKLTEQEGELRKFQGAILAADAQLKQGLDRADLGPIRMAHMRMHGLFNAHKGTKLWTETRVEVPKTKLAPERFPWESWTGQELYDRLTRELQEQNKTEPVWGFIPGGFAFVDLLVRATGSIPSFSYAFAALLLAIAVRAVVYPLTQRQLMWSRQMSQLQPLAKEIRERYPNPQEQQVKMMELYKEYGINPVAGCLPALLQMPLFFFVYQCMLLYQFEFTKGTFLWINEGTSRATNGFVAPNLGEVDYILIAVYTVSMIFSTLLAPVSDPSQAKQQRLIGLLVALSIPVFMSFGFFPVPAAFVLYWTFTNILATAQSLRAYRLPLPALVKTNTPVGGVYPGGSNGVSNGKVSGEIRTGTPAKHKPKKRK